MKLSIRADIELDRPGKAAYVTWVDVRLGDSSEQTFGIARVAIVHDVESVDAAKASRVTNPMSLTVELLSVNVFEQLSW